MDAKWNKIEKHKDFMIPLICRIFKNQAKTKQKNKLRDVEKK